MKTLIASLIIVFALVLISCEKDNKTTTATEDLSKYEVFNVHVQKFSNKTALGNYKLILFQMAWNEDGRSYIISDISYKTTDVNGNATFKIEKKKIIDSSNYFYYVAGTYDFNDSNNNAMFSGQIEVYHIKNSNTQLLEIQPTCSSYIQSDNKVWDELKIDTVVINNKNYYPLKLYSKEEKYEIKADCSETNTIKYYYYSNGVKSKEYSKDVYVPYSSQGSNSVTCTLDFK